MPTNKKLRAQTGQDLFLGDSFFVPASGTPEFSGDLVVQGDLTVNGTLTQINTTDLEVEDKLITLNKGGIANSGAVSGIEIEEASSITGYIKTASDRNGWEIKAPNSANVVTIPNNVGAADVVLTAGTQTVAGVKTFSSTIVGSINGNAATVTNGAYVNANNTFTGSVNTFINSTGTVFRASATADGISILGTLSGSSSRLVILQPASLTANRIITLPDIAGTVILSEGSQTVNGTKTFSNTITGSISGNAGSVTNGVYTTGDQSIGGIKTFTSRMDISHAGDEILRLVDTSTTGSPYLSFYQEGTRRGYIQFRDSDAQLFFRNDEEAAEFSLGSLTTLNQIFQITESDDQMMILNSSSNTGNPYLRFRQNGTNRGYIQYVDSGDRLRLARDSTYYMDILANRIECQNISQLALEETGNGGHFGTIQIASLSASYTFTVPNVGSSNFVMTAGSQTIGGAKTFSSAVDMNSTFTTFANVNINTGTNERFTINQTNLVPHINHPGNATFGTTLSLRTTGGNDGPRLHFFRNNGGVNWIVGIDNAINTGTNHLKINFGGSDTDFGNSGTAAEFRGDNQAQQGNNSSTWLVVSDERIKTNIQPLENGLETILALNGKRFSMKKTPMKPEVGFIAQEYEQVLPEQITNDPYEECSTDVQQYLQEGDCLKAISEKLSPFFVEAIKTLHQRNVELEERVTELETRLNSN